MKWNSAIVRQTGWNGEIINRAGKEKVAKQIAGKIKDGDVIGIGSGSTVYLALPFIADRIRDEHLRVLAIPASLEIAMICSKLEIPLTGLTEYAPDWVFDGADEVDLANNLIKGRGGAMFREKLLIRSGKKAYIIVDSSKYVPRLGDKAPVPVEVFPMALAYVEQELMKLGATRVTLRSMAGIDGPVISENGNFILDTCFWEITAGLEVGIKSIPGVIESGLFWGYPVEIVSADRVG